MPANMLRRRINLKDTCNHCDINLMCDRTWKWGHDKEEICWYLCEHSLLCSPLWLWHRRSHWTWEEQPEQGAHSFPATPAHSSWSSQGRESWQEQTFGDGRFRSLWQWAPEEGSPHLNRMSPKHLKKYISEEKIYQKQWKHKHWQALLVSSVTEDENCHPQTHPHRANLPHLIREILVAGFL